MKRVCVGLIGLILFGSFSAEAYTPPTGYILNQALKKRETFKELVFEGKVTDIKRNSVFKEKVWINFGTGKVFAAYFSPNDEPLGFISTNLNDLHRLGKFWFGIALDPNGQRFKKALEELNALPHEKSIANLTRVDKKVMWSWGDEVLIQFYKDEFLAADYQDGIGDSLEEINLKEYTSAGAAIRVPKAVVIKEKGQEVFSFEMKGLKINGPFKDPNLHAPIASESVQEWINLVR